MEIENFNDLKDCLVYRQWEDLIPALEKNMREGLPAFNLETVEEINGKETAYEATFRKHAERDFYYFNRINAALLEQGEVIQQASFRESWKLSPLEMGMILQHGSKVAVYKAGIKNDAGQSFNAYITVHPETPLLENGNLNLNTYHDSYYKKYPFELDNALARLPYTIKELAPDTVEAIKADLRQGIPVPVTVLSDGAEKPGYLTINARVGRVDVLDRDMDPMKLPQGQRKNEGQSRQVNAADQPEHTAGAVKKKPWQQRQQGVNWNKGKQGKGMSV